MADQIPVKSNRKPFCFIPARGGSKRVPRKNIIDLGGKPLIAWTIECAIGAGIFDDVFVSSEDEEILDVAAKYHAVPLAREKSLSGDRVTILEVLLNIIEQPAIIRDYTDIYLMNPTTPFRSVDTVSNAWNTFINSEADSLISLVEFNYPPQWALTVQDGYVKPIFRDGYKTIRQELEPAYLHDGGHLISMISSIREHRSLTGEKTIPFPVPENEEVDIDTFKDLQWARYLLSKEKEGA